MLVDLLTTGTGSPTENQESQHNMTRKRAEKGVVTDGV